MRRAALAAALAATLAGCPLPQPLPDYPAGTTITPPRILVDGLSVDGSAANGQAVVLVPAGCPREPVYPLSAHVFHTNPEPVDGRWFVNYNPEWNYTPVLFNTVLADPDPLVLTREVPPADPDTGAESPYVYRAYSHRPPIGTPQPAGDPPYKDAGLVRVVELVVSNGFDPTAVAPSPSALPYRTPRFTYETQVYRWVFVTVPTIAGCTLGEPGCCPAP